MPDIDPHEWLLDSGLVAAGCITVMVGLDRAAALAAFGADTTQVSPTDAYGFEDEPNSHVYVVEVPGGAAAFEYNGFWGSRPEVLIPASAGGRAASLFWNVEDDNAFTCAENGEIVATVDMYDAEDGDDSLPADLQSIFAQAMDEVFHWRAVGLSMVEQFTGIKVSAELLARATVGHPILGT
jgi:hypothetical protein